MTRTPSPADEVQALCERLIEGTFTADDNQRLEALVLGDPEAKRVYVAYMHQHATLSWQAGALAEPPLGEIVTVAPRRRVARRIAYAAALPAMLLIGLLGARLFGAETARPIATLTASDGTRWQGGALPTHLGARLTPGRLRLAGGLATIAFDSGAVVVVQAPAELELVSAMECVLHAGSILARVPPPAVGFTVRSATAIVIDHGTEFGVTAGPEGKTRVEVLSGLVEARHAHSSEQLRLATGQTAVFAASGVGRASSAAGEPAAGHAPARTAPGDLVISSAMGGGRATYIQSVRHAGDPSPDDLLLVKNAVQEAWHRKAYVVFDVQALAGRRVADASLTLTLAPTGLGYAALVPDATFSVYGVPGDAAAWPRGEMEWQRAPGNGAGGGGVDVARVVRVGSFVVKRGSDSGAFTVAGPPLAAFLEAERRALAGFLIVRDTAESHGHGLVHGFAGNHHPTGAPPTLRVTAK